MEADQFGELIGALLENPVINYTISAAFLVFLVLVCFSLFQDLRNKVRQLLTINSRINIARNNGFYATAFLEKTRKFGSHVSILGINSEGKLLYLCRVRHDGKLWDEKRGCILTMIRHVIEISRNEIRISWHDEDESIFYSCPSEHRERFVRTDRTELQEIRSLLRDKLGNRFSVCEF